MPSALSLSLSTASPHSGWIRPEIVTGRRFNYACEKGGPDPGQTRPRWPFTLPPSYYYAEGTLSSPEDYMTALQPDVCWPFSTDTGPRKGNKPTWNDHWGSFLFFLMDVHQSEV